MLVIALLASPFVVFMALAAFTALYRAKQDIDIIQLSLEDK